MGQIRRILAGDPHLLESGQGCRIDPSIQTEYLRSGGATTLIFMVDGAKAVISLSNDRDTTEHSSTTGKNNVCVQIFTDINITFHDGLEHSVMDTFSFLSD